MPYDYLGTFTRNQLLERNAFLNAQVHSLPGVIATLEAKRDRLGSEVLKDAAESFEITAEVCGRTYSLHTVTVPSFVPGTEISALHDGATDSQFPMRYDSLTGNLSHGDTAWRSEPRLLQVGDLQSDKMDGIPDDDAVPAQRSLEIVQEFRGVGKRADQLEDRVAKLRYRYLALNDEIDRKKTMLLRYTEEMAAVTAFLTNEVEVTGADGVVRTESDYPSAGVDLKTDVTSPDDIERIYDLLLAPVAESDDDEQDQVRGQLVPSDVGLQILSDVTDSSDPGDLSELDGEFPDVSFANIPRRKRQLVANVYEYGFKTGVMVEIPTSVALFRNPTGSGGDESGLFYAPPNVAADLANFASEVYSTYSIAFRVTEAWPPTANHGGVAHFTGNAIDLVFDLIGEDEDRTNLTLPELAAAIGALGVRRGYIRSFYNEYAHESTHKTGDHLHLDMNVQYFNDGALWRLR